MTRVGFSPSGVTGTQDVDIKTLGGSVIPAGPLPVSGTFSYSPVGTQDVDIKTLGGSLVPFGKLPVDATCSTVHATQSGTWSMSWTGTMDVDIKTLGGSLVPAGPLPVDATFAGTMDTDIKTLGGSLVPAGPLPVDISASGTLDVDIKTLGGSLVPAGPLPVDVITWSPTGTQDVEIVSWEAGTLDVDIVSAGTLDVDIKTLGGSLVPSGPLPISGTVSLSYPSTMDVDIKTLGGSLIPAGPLPVTGTVDISGLSGTLDVDIKTLGGSVVPSGPLPITGTVSISYPSTLDVDIKTLGGSVVPSGPLPVDVITWPPDETLGVEIVSWEAGTLDVDIKTLGGSLVPAAALPVQVTDNVDNLDVIPVWTSKTDTETGIVPLAEDLDSNMWERLTLQAPVDDIETGEVIPPLRVLPFNLIYDYQEGNWDMMRSAYGWSGGTKNTGEGIQDVALTARYQTDSSGTLQSLCADSSGNLYITGTVTTSLGGTLDVDIKTLGGSVVPSGPLPITGTVSISYPSTMDVDIRTLGGSLVPSGPLPVNVMNTATITGTVTTTLSGTLDVDIKTLGGSVVPSGPLPITGTVSISYPSTLDVDIKTLGGSLVPAGPLPVDALGVTTTVRNWLDDVLVGYNTKSLDYSSNLAIGVMPTSAIPLYAYDGSNLDRARTTGAMAGSTLSTGLLAIGEFGYDPAVGGGWRYKHVDSSGNLIVSSTSTLAGILGTMDVDIKTVGGEVVPNTSSDDISTSTRVVPVMGLNYTYDSAEDNWDRMRSAVAWTGGTKTTGEGIQDVAIVGRSSLDSSGTLQAIAVDSQGGLSASILGAAGFADTDGMTSLIISSYPVGAGLFTYNNVADDWDRGRSAESMVGSTIGSQGLLAIGEFGYDGSAWRAKAVDSSGYTKITGTVTTGAGTQDVDIKTLGGSVVPAGALPVQITDNVDNLDVIPMYEVVTTKNGLIPLTINIDDVKWKAFTSQLPADNLNPANYGDWTPLRVLNFNMGYDGTYWDMMRTTDAISGGTIDTGLLGAGIVERNHYCGNLFTSSVFTSAATLVPSSAYDISKFYTKTICYYVTGSASTIQVWSRCCSGNTYRNYYQDTAVPSTYFLTISFTEALYDAYVKVEVATAKGTVDCTMAMQT